MVIICYGLTIIVSTSSRLTVTEDKGHNVNYHWAAVLEPG